MPVLTDLVGMLQLVQCRLPREPSTGLVEQQRALDRGAVDRDRSGPRASPKTRAQEIGDGMGNAVGDPKIADGQPPRSTGSSGRRHRLAEHHLFPPRWLRDPQRTAGGGVFELSVARAIYEMTIYFNMLPGCGHV